MSCSECVARDKKIKVMESDFEFELRKIAEDKAEEKALFEISLQKELKKWQDKYQKQKLDHEENNKKWLSTIDTQASICEKKLIDFKVQKEKEVTEYKNATHHKYKEERETTLKQH